MNILRPARYPVFYIVIASLLSACGQGGGNSANSVAAPAENGSFLVFPNPQIQSNGSAQTLSTDYAEAYYRDVDPGNTRDSLNKWKAANHFGDTTQGDEVTVVFRDVRDLGYGRRMVARRNADGTVAMMVDNYQVTGVPGGAYTKLNVDAAVIEDSRWHLGTNAIEYSSSTGNAIPPLFVKFFTFSPSGQRKLTADMDGLGEKPLPAVCAVCHGGRADPLTPPGGPLNLPLFASVPNGVSGKRGDVVGRVQPLQIGTFEFSSLGNWSRADQEARFKTSNQIVLQTYPLPAASAFAEDALRPTAGKNEWQGTAAEFVKSLYGGDAMPGTYAQDTYVPIGWAGHESLYTSVVAPYCRSCHSMRGNLNQSDIDFDTYDKFSSYVKLIRMHVFDRGNMPLSRVGYHLFWSSSAPDVLANFLEGQGETGLRDAGGKVLRPGRPIAIPGPARTTTSPATLSAATSLNASTYQWSIVGAPAGVSLSSTTSATTLLTAPNGNFQVQLIVANGSGQSNPVTTNLKIVSALTSADGLSTIQPSLLRFRDNSQPIDIVRILQTPTTAPFDPAASPPTRCLHCHWRSEIPNGGSARMLALGQSQLVPPSFFDDYDRNVTATNVPDGVDAGIPGSLDDLWFYAGLRGKINFSDVEQSLLLRKPSNDPTADNHHHAFAHPIEGFDLAPGGNRANYDLILNWILNGAPYQ